MKTRFPTILILAALMCASLYFIMTRMLADVEANATQQIWSSGIAAAALLPFVFGVAGIQVWLVESSFSILRVSQILFAACLAVIYLEHRGRGGVHAVARDLQLMMIGPAYILSVLYRRLGIPL